MVENSQGFKTGFVSLLTPIDRMREKVRENLGFDPEALRGRVFSPYLNMAEHPELLYGFLMEYGLQGPCPWGDLAKREFEPFFPEERRRLPYLHVPLALEFGSGGFSWVDPLDNLQMGHRLYPGHVIYSDVSIGHNVGTRGIANVAINLLHPESVNLGGIRPHMIFARNVFTADGGGVPWSSRAEVTEATRAMCELLMPGGIICLISPLDRAYDGDVLKEFGAQEFSIREDPLTGLGTLGGICVQLTKGC